MGLPENKSRYRVLTPRHRERYVVSRVVHWGKDLPLLLEENRPGTGEQKSGTAKKKRCQTGEFGFTFSKNTEESSVMKSSIKHGNLACHHLIMS